MLIYSHCPVQLQWQLLHPAVSQSEFEAYPLVKSFFFATEMTFLRQNCGILSTRRGVVTIMLGFTQPITFTFGLEYGASGVQEIQVRYRLSAIQVRSPATAGVKIGERFAEMSITA